MDQTHPVMRIASQYQMWLLAAVSFAALYAISQFNYLLFHVLAELFSIIIAFTIFVLTWNARRTLKNGYLLFLGISFAFVGILDLVHTLTYKGMGLFPELGANIPTQLWLASRYLQAGSLVIAPLFLHRLFKPKYALGAYALVTALVLLTILTFRVFPVAYLEHTPMPLTPFKIGSEYAIILMYALGAALLLRIRHAFDQDMLRWMEFSILLNIPADFFFTQYLNPYDVRNLLGHFFKIASFYLIYKAVIEAAFIKPNRILFLELGQREQALRASEARERARAAQLEAIMDIAPAIICIAHDPRAEKITGNRAASDLLQVTAEDSPLLTTEDRGWPTHFRVFDPNWRELMPEELPLQVSAATGKPVESSELTFLFDTGEEHHLYGKVAPLFNETGQPSGAVAAFIDITGRVHAEEALHESEKRYRGLFENMAEGFSLQELIYDPDGRPVDYRFLEVNPAYEKMSGYRREDILGRTILEISPHERSTWIDRFARVVRDGRAARFEDYSVVFKKHFEVMVNPIGKNQYATLLIDVTERRENQEALRKSEARLRRLVDSNIIGIMYSGQDGRISVANDAFLDIIGYTREDFDTDGINWIDLTPPELMYLDQIGIVEATERGACTPYEKEYIRKDGTRVPILIGYAFFAASDPPYICFILDLTEQKQAEAAVKENAAQLERSNRELENFAFVASHDMQEPLRKIQAFGDRLQSRLQGQIDEESSDYLARMLNAASRMQVMINDLLSLSRITTRGMPFEQVDLDEATAEVVSDLVVRIERSGGSIEIDSLPVVDGDPTQLRQLMQNLINNAFKFHKPDVPPVVRVYSEYKEEAQQVRIYVEDNGIGFEEQYLERIFQPFQRLHGMGQFEGSGIGLAICRKIVERHSGVMTAHSQPGIGSTFIVTLPVQQSGGVAPRQLSMDSEERKEL